MRGGITAIIAGLVVMILFGTLSGTVLSTFATAGAESKIGSFGSTRDVNDLIPLIWYIGGMVIGVGLMIMGGLGVAGRGPIRGR